MQQAMAASRPRPDTKIERLAGPSVEPEAMAPALSCRHCRQAPGTSQARRSRAPPMESTMILQVRHGKRCCRGRRPRGCRVRTGSRSGPPVLIVPGARIRRIPRPASGQGDRRRRPPRPLRHGPPPEARARLAGLTGIPVPPSANPSRRHRARSTTVPASRSCRARCSARSRRPSASRGRRGGSRAVWRRHGPSPGRSRSAGPRRPSPGRPSASLPSVAPPAGTISRPAK